MGQKLPQGGPAGLFIGFLVYGTIILAVNQCFGAFLRQIRGLSAAGRQLLTF